jgi:hypothetical protein
MKRQPFLVGAEEEICFHLSLFRKAGVDRYYTWVFVALKNLTEFDCDGCL